MKTINDLVDKLNNYVAYGEYYVRKGKAEEYLLCKRCVDGGESILFDFAKRQPYWSIHAGLGAMHNQVQKDIMDFVYTTDKEHWFDKPEKKYNIIIGEDVGTKWKSVYRKLADDIGVLDTVKPEALTLAKYIFTETEIEDLKTKVSERSAKIIDLGKVEVKDD